MLKFKVKKHKLKQSEIRKRSVVEALDYVFDSYIPSPYWVYPFFDVRQRVEEISQKYIEHELKKE